MDYKCLQKDFNILTQSLPNLSFLFKIYFLILNWKNIFLLQLHDLFKNCSRNLPFSVSRKGLALLHVAKPFNPNFSLTSLRLSESMGETTFCTVRGGS